MQETRRRGSLELWLSLALVLVLITTGSAVATAGSDGPYNVTWYTIDGGGGTGAGDGYRLDGTAGQPEPGEMIGNSYRLVGGFWGGGVGVYRVYLPLVVSGG